MVAYRLNVFRIRVMQINQLRGLLYEFGIGLPQGRRPSIEAAKAALASLDDQLPAMLTDSLQDQLSKLRTLEEQIERLERRIQDWRRNDEACRRISDRIEKFSLDEIRRASVDKSLLVAGMVRRFFASAGPHRASERSKASASARSRVVCA
jgi:transposase